MKGQKNINFIIGFGIIFIIGIFLFSLLLYNSPDKEIQETGKIRELKLEVKGLVCQACANIVKSSLEGTPGIINTTVDLESGNTILNYNDFVITKNKILNHDIFSGYYTAKFVEEKIMGDAPEFTFESSQILDYDYRYVLEPLQKLEAKILVAIRSKEGIDEIVSLFDEVESRGLEIKEGTQENNEKRIKIMLRLSSLIENLGTSYTPGTYIYPAKTKAEKVRFSLSPTVIYKAKNQFLIANNRIKEMNFLLNLNKIEENKEELTEVYSTSLSNTLKFVKTAKEKGKEKKQLLLFSDLVLKEVNENLPKHIEVLEKIYGKDIPKAIEQTISDLSNLHLKTSSQTSNIFLVDGDEIPKFLNFIKAKGWYAHKIIQVEGKNKLMIVRDGIDHEFPIDFGFAGLHLREHHGVGSYLDEMGLLQFLEFAMENNLYQHRMDKIISEDKVVIIKGDEGTDFETTFEMTFENIIKHMRLDHKWTNQELLDANYCQEVFEDEEVDNCIKRLTE